MRVNIAATGRFHYLDLARQLAMLGVLQAYYTAYPAWKMDATGIGRGHVHHFPWLHVPYMLARRSLVLSERTFQLFDWVDRVAFDKYVASAIRPSDIFTAISGCGLTSARRAKGLGAKYVCDRGSTHISYQDRLLHEEHQEWGIPYTPTHPRIVERELSEYAEADLITVPSGFAKASFLAEGIPDKKLVVLPYGADLKQFSPVGKPSPHAFVITFVGGLSLRKGLPYLLLAYRGLRLPSKRLTLIGQVDPKLIDRLKKIGLWSDGISIHGHLDQASLRSHFSRSNVMVLPSVEDGFGLVVGQAMACGCPVITSTQAGASDVVRNGINGYIVPARNAKALTEALERVADDRDAPAMRRNAIATVETIGGWDAYGAATHATYQRLLRCH